MQLRITYSDSFAAALTGSSDNLGRRITIPLRFVIQPTLQITLLRFLQHAVPLHNGQRYVKPKLNLQDANLNRDPGLYRSNTLQRQGAHHARNSSDSAILPTGVKLLLPPLTSGMHEGVQSIAAKACLCS